MVSFGEENNALETQYTGLSVVSYGAVVRVNV